MRGRLMVISMSVVLVLAAACSGGGTGEVTSPSSVSNGTDGGSSTCTGHGPPAEAVAACSGLAEGDACTFSMFEKTISGNCHAGPDGALACAMPPPTPPQEAIDACAGLADGADCSFLVGGKETLSGKCHAGPDGNGVTACGPEGGNPPPGGDKDGCPGKPGGK